MSKIKKDTMVYLSGIQKNETYIVATSNDSKESIQSLLENKITELLVNFNHQIIELLEEVETKKFSKKGRLKKTIEKIRQKILDGLTKKTFQKHEEIGNTVAKNCAKLLASYKDLEETFQPVFANLILNPEVNGGVRILTLSLRQDNTGKPDFDVQNLMKESLGAIHNKGTWN